MLCMYRDSQHVPTPVFVSEVFSSKNLSRVARKLGNEWRDLAYQLDFETYDCDNFAHGGKPPKEAATAMLIAYR